MSLSYYSFNCLVIPMTVLISAFIGSVLQGMLKVKITS